MCIEISQLRYKGAEYVAQKVKKLSSTGQQNVGTP
jgi:hypothetical protein